MAKEFRRSAHLWGDRALWQSLSQGQQMQYTSLPFQIPVQRMNESSSRFTPGSCRALSTRRAGGLDADADTHLGEDLIERADGREEYNRVH